MIFFFQFIYIVDYNDRFFYVEPSLHLWNEANLIRVDDFFDVFLNYLLLEMIPLKSGTRQGFYSHHIYST